MHLAHATPRWDIAWRSWTLRRWPAGWRRSDTPLRSGRSTGTSRLISKRMNVLRDWSIALTGRLSRLEKLEPCFDMNVAGVEFRSTGVCIKRVGSLIVAGLVLHES